MLQFDVATRNARLDAVEVTIGVSPVLRIRTGPPPASVAAADTGTVLAEITLPADYLTAAAGGVKSMQGTWSTSAIAAGQAGHFRIYSTSAAARLQGTCAESGADMLIDTATVEVGQTLNVRTFALTDGNA